MKIGRLTGFECFLARLFPIMHALDNIVVQKKALPYFTDVIRIHTQ